MALLAPLGLTLVLLALIPIEAIVRAHLDRGLQDGPTRIYARPLVLYPGLRLDRAEVERELQRLGYRRSESRSIDTGEYEVGWRTITVARRGFRHFDRVDPGGMASIRFRGGDVAGLYGTDGRRLPRLGFEPELLHTLNRGASRDLLPVRLSDVPPHLVEAVIAIEDQRFFRHAGLDLRRVAGAMVANLRAQRVVQGGSTLTQQLARNLYLTPRRTPVRKLREAAIAVVLELRYSKERILETYLNEIYLGQDGALAIHGVGRAAQFYFGKDVSRLDLAEAALLAAIIRGPSLYSPSRHPEAARRRRDLVLQLMVERGVISDSAFRRAREAPFRLRPERRIPRSARYFVDFVGADLRRRHGDRAVEGGLAVFTTLDLELQRVAEEAVNIGLADLETRYPQLQRPGSPLQAALVALDPRTGELLAMVGGRDYGQSQFNRAAHAHRQPGSSFKPIVALAALSRPRGVVTGDARTFTLATILQDEPLSVTTPAGLWEPSNYDDRFRGRVTLREALERSLNVPFARLGLAVGPERIVATAEALGIGGPLDPVPSIALGAADVTPLEMTRAFGVLAAGGYRADLRTTLGVLDRDGSLLERGESEGERVFDPAEAYLVTSALRGAVERGTGRALRALGYRGDIAAKSGTTNSFRDGWFIGYTPNLALGVWVGFDDGFSIGLPGSAVALPIFARFLMNVVGPYGDREFRAPDGLELVSVDRETGLRAGWGCRGEPELFLEGTAPEESCSPFWAWSRRERDERWRESLTRLLEQLRRRVERELREESDRRTRRYRR